MTKIHSNSSAILRSKNSSFSLKVLIITNEGLLSPCFRLRLGYFFEYLKKQNRVDYFVNDLSCYSMSDVILFQRAATFTPELVRLMIDSPKPIIYETDDLLQQITLRTHSRSTRSSMEAKLNLLGSWNAVFITSTPYLANKLSAYTDDVNVIYNTSYYDSFAAPRIAVKDTCIVSFIGTPTHSRDFSTMGDALKKVAEKYNHVRYLFFGDTPLNLQEQIRAEYCSYSNDYQKAINHFRSYKPDIGLAPLLDNQFNRSKSAIKYIDYTYVGATGIYSDIIPYRGIIGGLLVKNHPNQWYESICSLIENPELRNQLYKKAIEDINARFSFTIEAERFYCIIKRVAATKPLSSNSRKKEVIRLTQQARDTGQLMEFLEYVRLFCSVCLKGHISTKSIFDVIMKIDRKAISINLITDILDAMGAINALNTLKKSWTDTFVNIPYSIVRNTELEMYQFASKEKTSGLYSNALPIFERILKKGIKDEIRAGAAFHLGEIALNSNDFSKAKNFFDECLLLNPEHHKSQEILRTLTREFIEVLTRCQGDVKNKTTKMKSKPFNILTYRWHTAHQYELFKLGHRFTLVTGSGTNMCEKWDYGQRPLPDNVKFKPLQEISIKEYDFAILPFDENTLDAEHCNGIVSMDWGKTFLNMLEFTQGIPRTAICHGTPHRYGDFLKENIPIQKNADQIFTSKREAFCNLLKNIHVVCNSHQALTEWGFRKSSVIWHGFSPHEFTSGKHDKSCLTLTEQAFEERAYYRGEICFNRIIKLLKNICEVEYTTHPNPYTIENKVWAMAKFQIYARYIGQFAIYLNPTINSPMPRSRGEAMMTGTIPVSLRNHDVDMFIQNGANGFYGDTAEEVAEHIAWLIKNENLRKKISKNARNTAMDVFNIDRFLSDWNKLFKRL